jgi:hypothetical protein
LWPHQTLHSILHQTESGSKPIRTINDQNPINKTQAHLLPYADVRARASFRAILSLPDWLTPPRSFTRNMELRGPHPAATPLIAWARHAGPVRHLSSSEPGPRRTKRLSLLPTTDPRAQLGVALQCQWLRQRGVDRAARENEPRGARTSIGCRYRASSPSGGLRAPYIARPRPRSAHRHGASPHSPPISKTPLRPKEIEEERASGIIDPCLAPAITAAEGLPAPVSTPSPPLLLSLPALSGGRILQCRVVLGGGGGRV